MGSHPFRGEAYVLERAPHGCRRSQCRARGVLRLRACQDLRRQGLKSIAHFRRVRRGLGPKNKRLNPQTLDARMSPPLVVGLAPRLHQNIRQCQLVGIIVEELVGLAAEQRLSSRVATRAAFQ